ncbi:hypothetical protein AK830_g192 [Neonectria ditissima]|uniref:Chromo domain-containing protein n=1 Tax=Neonectria ditissima TaxID=78410 RepID=A0A0P7BZ60_9HYPO|nr:hypothetical protein AK830_g192 [Neonectria ditissima]
MPSQGGNLVRMARIALGQDQCDHMHDVDSVETVERRSPRDSRHPAAQSTNDQQQDYTSSHVVLQRAVTREQHKEVEMETETEEDGEETSVEAHSDFDNEDQDPSTGDEELSSEDEASDDGVASSDNTRQRSYPPRQFSPPFPPEPKRKPFPLARAPLSARFPNGLTRVIERRDRDAFPASRASSVSRCSSEDVAPPSPATLVAHRRRSKEELFDFLVVQPDGSRKWRSEDSVEADDRNAVYEYWDRFPNGRRHFMRADVWYMAQIEAHVSVNRGYSMRVRWLGSPLRSWERQSRVRQIAPDLLNDYLRDKVVQVTGKRGSSNEQDDSQPEGDEGDDDKPKRRRLD